MKKHLPLLILALFPFSLVGQECISGDCVNGQGTYIFPDGAKYVGEYKDGERNGQGTYTDSNGDKYVGDFKDGNRHGRGAFATPDGTSYVGEWKDGLPNGQGNSTWNNGQKYVGAFKDSKRHGKGTLVYPDGTSYVGEWKDGTYNGQGTLYEANGQIISSGLWVNDFLKEKESVSETSSPITTSVKSSGSSISGFVAVLEFEGNGISSSEAKALSNRLRSELVTIGELTIIERGKMDEVLKEQAFQQTGCVSSECAVEVGKLLGVENIITGSISKVGTIYSVEARAVSVETGEIIKSAVYDHSGDIGGLLTQGMRKVAEELGK